MFLQFLYCIVFSLILLSTPSASLEPQEALHLLRFRQSLPEASQLLLPWNHSNYCLWPGISCSSNHVTSLSLSMFNLSGILEDSISHLCALEGLTILDLSGNKFSGGIPAMLGNCSKVNTLLLNDNEFSGPIPPQLFESHEIKLIELNLAYNQLSGSIPPEVGKCKSLEHLQLSSNHLTGEIPSELLSLPNLNYLSIAINNLTGHLPDFPPTCSLLNLEIHENQFNAGSWPVSLSNCHNLTSLDLSHTNLWGTIPNDFFNSLQKLEILYLFGNHLQGLIPESLWDLRNLQMVGLPENKFNGSISENVGKCDRLSYLDLSGNQLAGSIPASICSLENLQYLYLYDNKLDGSLSNLFARNSTCTFLVGLHIENNRISGVIPPEICDLQNLKSLYLAENRLEGPIPNCLERLTSLEVLALDNNNRITGEIPSGIAKLTNLTEIYLAHNNLTGEVPADLGRNNVPGLIILDLTGNNLSGEIPKGLCSGNQLQVLDLGDNRFNCNFPVEIIRCTSLYRVILEKNLLYGNIPEDIGNNSVISYFSISGNNLQGNIPNAFGSWTNLSTLDLSRNNFSGPIPPQLGMLQNLVKLRISSNRLSGQIPPDLGRLPRLLEVDLSSNGLSGSIPQEIFSSPNLEVIFLQDNRFTGVIPNVFSRSQRLRELQLGSNTLEGGIPCSLATIDKFEILNLSMNNFSGQIPRCLGDLDSLVKLDISTNKFSGRIPSQVDDMKALVFLNISFNNLEGQIPASWEKIYNKNPDSSLGNPRLCLKNIKLCGRSHKNRGFVLAVVLAVSCLLTICLLASVYVSVLICVRRSKQDESALLQKSHARSEDLPKDLCFKGILRATEGWSDKYIIGRGKHGIVYRIESTDSRKEYAVKKVLLSSEANLYTEIRALSMVRHRNVIKMEGYSIRDENGVIVTNYMPEGTLHDVLHRRNPQVVLDWETRWRIALGIAQALSYLHHDCVPQIIHRDMKSDNIFLDAELEPKIGDFGMAKLEVDVCDSLTISAIVGTLGYIAPENAYSTRLTEKCDVYSYGVILLELFCRKLPVDSSFDEGDIVSWVRKNFMSSNDCFCCLDSEIQEWKKEDQHRAMGMINTALRCTQMVPEVRPSMRNVVGSILKIYR